MPIVYDESKRSKGSKGAVSSASNKKELLKKELASRVSDFKALEVV